MDFMLCGSSLQKGYIKIKRPSYAFYSWFEFTQFSPVSFHVALTLDVLKQFGLRQMCDCELKMKSLAK